MSMWLGQVVQDPRFYPADLLLDTLSSKEVGESSISWPQLMYQGLHPTTPRVVDGLLTMACRTREDADETRHAAQLIVLGAGS